MAKSGPSPKTLDVTKVESIAAMGGTNNQIAEALGVSDGTLKNIRRRNKAVNEAIKNGKDKADLAVVGALYKKALAGDTTAMIFWLKNRQPDRWRDKRDLEHSGRIDCVLTFEFGESIPEAGPRAAEEQEEDGE